MIFLLHLFYSDEWIFCSCLAHVNLSPILGHSLIRIPSSDVILQIRVNNAIRTVVKCDLVFLYIKKLTWITTVLYAK